MIETKRIDLKDYTLTVSQREDQIHIIFSFKDIKFYEMLKLNGWKKFNFKGLPTVELFKGYNDNHRAMKFIVPISRAIEHLDRLRTMLERQVTLFEIINKSYEDYVFEKQETSKRNYNIFMDSLRSKL